MNLLLTTYEKKRFLSGTCGGVEGGKDVFKTSVLVLRIFLYIIYCFQNQENRNDEKEYFVFT